MSARLARCGWTLLLVLAWGAEAASNKTLTWDASPQLGLVGYQIYYGTASYNYDKTVTVGNVTRATIDGLTAGTTYYFAVTALYGFGEESDFSNEAIYVVPNSEGATFQVALQADGGTQLTGNGQTGHTYQIQATSDFVVWTTIATRSADAGGGFEFLDYSPATFPTRVYRLQDLGYAALPAAQLQINVPANRVVQLTASGVAGHAYEIQATTDLITWAAIGSQPADNNGVFIFSDPAAPSLPSRFYRLKDLGYMVAAMAQLQISTSPNGVVNLSGTGQVGHNYEILASTDLNIWTAIGSQTADASGAFAFTDFEAPNYSTRFYRTLDSQP